MECRKTNAKHLPKDQSQQKWTVNQNSKPTHVTASSAEKFVWADHEKVARVCLDFVNQLQSSEV